MLLDSKQRNSRFSTGKTFNRIASGAWKIAWRLVFDREPSHARRLSTAHLQFEVEQLEERQMLSGASVTGIAYDGNEYEGEVTVSFQDQTRDYTTHYTGQLIFSDSEPPSGNTGGEYVDSNASSFHSDAQLGVGTHTIWARVNEYDYYGQESVGQWVSNTITIESSNDAPQITSLLFDGNEYGGQFTGGIADGTREYTYDYAIEFAISEQQPSSGQFSEWFSSDATSFSFDGYLSIGLHTVWARAINYDYLGATLTGEWFQTSIEVVSSNTPPSIYRLEYVADEYSGTITGSLSDETRDHTYAEREAAKAEVKRFQDLFIHEIVRRKVNGWMDTDPETAWRLKEIHESWFNEQFYSERTIGTGDDIDVIVDDMMAEYRTSVRKLSDEDYRLDEVELDWQPFEESESADRLDFSNLDEEAVRTKLYEMVLFALTHAEPDSEIRVRVDLLVSVGTSGISQDGVEMPSVAPYSAEDGILLGESLFVEYVERDTLDKQLLMAGTPSSTVEQDLSEYYAKPLVNSLHIFN